MFNIGDYVECQKWGYTKAVIEDITVLEDGKLLLTVSQPPASGCVYADDCVLI